MRLTPLGLCICAAWSLPSLAAQLDLSLEIPQLDVAEYHRPYVAAWIEDDSRHVARNLLVWYQQDRRNPSPNAEQGSKWLPDLRQWWRRTGRALDLPLDGVSAATRAVGVHRMSFQLDTTDQPDLAPGHYKLRIEAAREEGGRELIDLPFDWPATAPLTLNGQGGSELGAIRVTITP